MSKASIYFFPEPRKKNSKTGKLPIYLRILINRTKAEIRLSCDIEVTQLHLWNPRIMRFEDNKMAANKLLNKYQQDFEALVYKYASDLGSLAASSLRDELMGTVRTGDTIKGYVNLYYKESVEHNASITAGTKKNYLKAIHHLEAYLEYSNQALLPLAKADGTFGHRFLDYLLSTIPEKKKVGMQQSSAAGNVKKLKAIFERAFENGKIERNPFKTVKLKVQSRYKEKLNSNEVKTLFTHDLSSFPSLNNVRLRLLFSIFTGLAFEDASNLLLTDIQTWEKNEFFMHLERIKTGVETKQFLVSQAIEIINTFKLSFPVKGTALPPISNQQFNLRLKILGERIGITKNLTSHIARHTFRQMLSEAGITDLASIKTMMGHSRRNDIDSVYHSVTENQLLVAKQQYQTFLNKLFADEC